MEYRAKKVLVTGADGFIGSHLAEALVSKGARVTALAAYNLFNSHGWLDDPPPAIQSSMIRVRGDVRDPPFIRRIVAGQDVVSHLAALIAIPYSYVAAQSYVETNIIGTLNVLEEARESAVQRVVHTSTSEVYSTALTMPITGAAIRLSRAPPASRSPSRAIRCRDSLPIRPRRSAPT